MFVDDRRCSSAFKIGGAVKHFTNFTGKHLCWSLFLIKLQAVTLRTSIKTVNVKNNVFVIQYFHFLLWELLKKTENDEDLVSIKTEKVSGKLTLPFLSCSDSSWSDSAYKSAKRDLFPQHEGNCWANITSNQWHNPCNVCA